MERSAQLKDDEKEHLLKLLEKMKSSVPAYRAFLATENLDGDVSEVADIPVMTKQNYLKKHDLSELTSNGDVTLENNIVSMSSGSSGVPFFWPRGQKQHDEAAEIYSAVYRHIFEADKKKTLLVVCFSMGSWIAGTYTTFGAIGAAAKELKLVVASPALNFDESLDTIQKLHSEFEQVIIAGYPPFVRDLLLEGRDRGLDWGSIDLGLSFAGEMITESWRDNTIKLADIQSPYKTMNIYGTADMGIVGHETPLSIAVKRYLSRNQLTKSLAENDFTLVQYDPSRLIAEEVEGELIFSYEGGIPLLRYGIGDAGGIMSFHDLSQEAQIEITRELQSAGHEPGTFGHSLLFVKGRSDLSASLYAVNIYPEHIKEGLENPSIFNEVTGRFKMRTMYTEAEEQFLSIQVEARQEAYAEDLPSRAEAAITDALSTLSSEFRKLKEMLGEKAKVNVSIVVPGDNAVADRSKNKQDWTSRNDDLS